MPLKSDLGGKDRQFHYLSLRFLGCMYKRKVMFSERGSGAQMLSVGRRVLNSGFLPVPTELLLKCPSMAFSISLLIQQAFNYYVSPSPESLERS